MKAPFIVKILSINNVNCILQLYESCNVFLSTNLIFLMVVVCKTSFVRCQNFVESRDFCNNQGSWICAQHSKIIFHLEIKTNFKVGKKYKNIKEVIFVHLSSELIIVKNPGTYSCRYANL